MQRYVNECLAGRAAPRGTDFNMRWIASLVAEMHRILMRGGVFMYPRDSKDPRKPGRLRLLYEANPMATDRAGRRAGQHRARADPRCRAAELCTSACRFDSARAAEVERIERYHRDPTTSSTARRSPLFNERGLFTQTHLIRGASPCPPSIPIIAVTGSSGAGTTSVSKTFEQIFRREHIKAALVEGDSFHRYDRADMREQLAEALARGDHHFSHFGPEANLFAELERPVPAATASAGTRQGAQVPARRRGGRTLMVRRPARSPSGRMCPPNTDLLFYEGLHGAVVTDEVNVAQHVDLLIGVMPVINLEWIQKLHRDKSTRGYSAEAVIDTILRRMPDYVNYICPQFSRTHVNFQRVPTVDTSNPFIARFIPAPDESFLVIRFQNPHGIDFPYLLSMLHDSFMSRPNTIVCPGGKMDLAMQLIFTPMIWRLMERRKDCQAREGRAVA